MLKPKKKLMNFWIDAELKKAAEEAAKEDSRTLSSFINHAIKVMVDSKSDQNG
jgi:predicted HicB family RNase H-like nuclease